MLYDPPLEASAVGGLWVAAAPLGQGSEEWMFEQGNAFSWRGNINVRNAHVAQSTHTLSPESGAGDNCSALP